MDKNKREVELADVLEELDDIKDGLDDMINEMLEAGQTEINKKDYKNLEGRLLRFKNAISDVYNIVEGE